MAVVIDSPIVSGVRSLHSRYGVPINVTDGYLKPIAKEFSSCVKALEFMFGSVIGSASFKSNSTLSRYDLVDDYKLVNQLITLMEENGLPNGVIEPLQTLSSILKVRFEQAALADVDFAQLRDWWSI